MSVIVFIIIENHLRHWFQFSCPKLTLVEYSIDVLQYMYYSTAVHVLQYCSLVCGLGSD